MSTTPLNISFQRALVGNKLVAWHDLVAKIANISLNDQIDSFRWLQTKDKQFIKVLLTMLQRHKT